MVKSRETHDGVTGNHFSPADVEEHERGNAGEDVADLCRNCRRPFMEHRNSRCPNG